MHLSGSNLDFLFAFLGGLAVSFTPCVYPLLPITIGVIGANATSRLKGFILSLLYVTCMAITYVVLGLFASLTGKLFGKIVSYPATYFIVGGLTVMFGLYYLDIIKIPLPKASFNAPNVKNNYLSVILLGLISGLIVGPCTAPALGAILVYVSSKQNLLYGTLLLLSFAYGMGTLLILAGTFSSVLANLPKSGDWLNRVKRICGIILVLAGIWFTFVGIGRM